MDKTNCIIDQGSFFTVEWFYDETGYSQPYEYFLAISNDQKRKFLLLVKKMAEMGKIIDITKFRNEGDDIYAFKPQPDRYLSFFIKGKKIIVTNAFEKKSDKLPQNEKNRAMKQRDSYLQRNKEGSYYG